MNRWTFNLQSSVDITCQNTNPGAEALLTAAHLAVQTLPDEQTLATLPLGARLILRCRADWRDATVAAITPDRVVLSVNSPSGRTYRVRRPATAILCYDGHIPVLGEGSWRAGMARYDARW